MRCGESSPRAPVVMTRPVDAGIGEAVLDVAVQHRMRADLDENVDAFVHHAANGLLEQHRLADVAPPVLGVQRLAFESAPVTVE
jgi:hypothetical protein